MTFYSFQSYLYRCKQFIFIVLRTSSNISRFNFIQSTLEKCHLLRQTYVHEQNRKNTYFYTFYNRQSNQQQTKSNQENYIPSYTKKNQKQTTYFIYSYTSSIYSIQCTHPPNSTSSNYPFLLPLKPNERLFSSLPKSFQYLSMYDCHQ